MAKASEFDKSASNRPAMASSKTDPGAASPKGARSGVGGGKSRGVENPIPEDMALIGDTRHGLHTQSLPRKYGPNFGYGEEAPSDQFRVDCGDGVAGCL